MCPSVIPKTRLDFCRRILGKGEHEEEEAIILVQVDANGFSTFVARQNFNSTEQKNYEFNFIWIVIIVNRM